MVGVETQHHVVVVMAVVVGGMVSLSDISMQPSFAFELQPLLAMVLMAMAVVAVGMMIQGKK